MRCPGAVSNRKLRLMFELKPCTIVKNKVIVSMHNVTTYPQGANSRERMETKQREDCTLNPFRGGVLLKVKISDLPPKGATRHPNGPRPIAFVVRLFTKPHKLDGALTVWEGVTAKR